MTEVTLEESQEAILYFFCKLKIQISKSNFKNHNSLQNKPANVAQSYSKGLSDHLNRFLTCESNCQKINTKQIFSHLINEYCWKYFLICMNHFAMELDEPLLSPTNFILQPPEPDQLLPPLSGYRDSQALSQFKDQDEGARTSSRDQKKRLAGVKSRQKKKKYVQNLEENVKTLTAEIEKFEAQISKCKDQLVEAIKASNQHVSEHAYTLTQLETNVTSEDPDIDKVNFLLDLIQSRIGANGKERQANLDYTFKQIINSMFPAMHRYLMHSATYQQNMFIPDLSAQALQTKSSGWTQELFSTIKLSSKQVTTIRTYEPRLQQKRTESVELIRRLRNVKRELKCQEDIFEQKIQEFREDLSPIQAGLFAVFGEKNKLRREFCLCQVLEDTGPRKKVKIQ